MDWNRKKNHLYLYKSVRHGKRVRKVYLGRGPAAEFAYRTYVLQQHELREIRRKWREQKAKIDDALVSTSFLYEVCDELRDAVLLAAGYHRSSQFHWVKWHAARPYAG
jgi:hypothetical protein